MPLFTSHGPGEEQDYVEKTSDTSVTATAEASADTVVTANALTFDGATTIVVELWCPALRPAAAAGAAIRLWLYDGSSSIGQLAAVESPAAGAVFLQFPAFVSRRITPTAASHTYSIRSTVNAGTGTVRGGAGGSGNVMPAYVRITRV